MEMSDENFREHIARSINYSEAHDTIQSMTNVVCFRHLRGMHVIFINGVVKEYLHHRIHDA